MSKPDSETGQPISLRVVVGLNDFHQSEWETLSGTSRKANDIYNPFISHAFLSALEDSACVSAETGWLPQHLRLENGNGTLLGAVPCYVKSHSQGEYVFDHGWADAFERAGGRYYPKLQSGIPFTPATGSRLLSISSDKTRAIQTALCDGIRTLGEQFGVSSAHVTFAPESEARLMEERGFLHRTDQQFHFLNKGYEDYEGFLATLTSRKRKALKKERRTALENDIAIECLTGSDLTEAVWDDFFSFYLDTGSRKWGRPYLNRKFFSLIGERMANDILLVMARRNHRYIAGAINFLGSQTIFGRHWGCIEDHPYLHFEVCYHQAIDYALAHGFKSVEAGAQGEHKLARGYQPVTTHSLHWIAHPGLRDAVAAYLIDERNQVDHYQRILSDQGPFKKDR